jgi:uncharacterized membrane protein YphA (DoxX/SURF4 family)
MSSKVEMGLRILLGLLFLVFGINKFANFLPPFELSGDGEVLLGIYVSSGFFSIIGALEAIFGLALILNKFVPLALTFLVAIAFNAFIFHLLHDLAGIGGAVVALSLSLILVFLNRDRFSQLLKA